RCAGGAMFRSDNAFASASAKIRIIPGTVASLSWVTALSSAMAEDACARASKVGGAGGGALRYEGEVPGSMTPLRSSILVTAASNPLFSAGCAVSGRLTTASGNRAAARLGRDRAGRERGVDMG